MTYIEHKLELYYNQYEQFIDTWKKEHNEELPELKDIKGIHLGINQSRTSDDCQKLINYLVYLESMAVLVDRNILHVDVIDDLFSYRFFLAVNNPIVQQGELYPYADFYKGIFKLSEKWAEKHDDNSTPMKEFLLSKEKIAGYKEKNLDLLDVGLASGADKKLEIANCLYGTDPYIYPEAFGENEEQASKAISRIIGMDGSLLDYNKIYVARYNGQICGVCLYNDGTGKWDEEKILKRIGNDYMPERLKEGFMHASNEYFGKLSQEKLEQNTIEIVAFSVAEGFRRKNIGNMLMKKFLEEKGSDHTIILTVLSDNVYAIDFYKSEKNKFEEIQSSDIYGFAPQGLKKPRIKHLERRPQPYKVI